MREEEIAAGPEARVNPHAEQVSCIGVETHRLTSEQAVDPGAPLLPDPSRLNTGSACANTGSVQHRDRRAALR